jgi:hypothetical protein
VLTLQRLARHFLAAHACMAAMSARGMHKGPTLQTTSYVVVSNSLKLRGKRDVMMNVLFKRDESCGMKVICKESILSATSAIGVCKSMDFCVQICDTMCLVSQRRLHRSFVFRAAGNAGCLHLVAKSQCRLRQALQLFRLPFLALQQRNGRSAPSTLLSSYRSSRSCNVICAGGTLTRECRGGTEPTHQRFKDGVIGDVRHDLHLQRFILLLA